MLQMFVLALSLYNTWNRGVFLLCKITNLLIYSCKFNIDTACVELRYADGEILSIDCIAVEDEFGYSPHARVELDWLIYNDPLSYAQMVLGGTLINYLKDIVSPHSLELDNYS